MFRPPPRSTLFPYTPLFRSDGALRRRHRHVAGVACGPGSGGDRSDRKSTRLNSSHSQISYAVFCLKKKKKKNELLPISFAAAIHSSLLKHSSLALTACTLTI